MENNQEGTKYIKTILCTLASEGSSKTNGAWAGGGFVLLSFVIY